MREKRLLERLRIWKKGTARQVKEDPGNMIDSIRAHLQRVLNTQKGTVPIDDEYGLPDFTDLPFTYPDSIAGLERAIQQTIGRYEPRLESVRVSFIADEENPLSLRFKITARAIIEKDRIPVYFESVVDSDGRVSMRG